MLKVHGGLSMPYLASTIQNTQGVARDISIQIGADGSNPTATISMAALSCYVGNASAGASIYTTIRNANALQSDARFEGDINLPAGLILGNNDLYLGRYANAFTPNALEGAAGNFIETAGDNSNPAGTVRKQFAAVDDEFYFPIGPAGARMSPITFRVVAPTASSAFQYQNPNAVPWPHISVRCVLNQGGSGGHPENQQQQKVWVHWPVIGHGLVCWGIHWAGLMTFHNNYRNGNAADLYSARYFDNYELVGQFGGWILTGSVQVTTTTGDLRSVPFGPWNNSSVPGMPCWGDFTVGQGNPGTDPIPVELTAFSARYIRNSVELSWQTATELNNYGFAIERSRDGRVWDEIDFVPGAGNSFSPKSYSYTDVLDAGMSRVPQLAYRLRQIDRDGTTEYSDVVFVALRPVPIGVTLYNAYPNPFNPATTLSFSLSEATVVTVKVYDMFGREAATLLDNAELSDGVHTAAFRAAGLPSGSYIVVLNAGSVTRQQRVVLSK
jgi:hypothetical protein